MFDTQSPLTAHIFCDAHLGQVSPPQSTSVSSWFLTPSVQVGAVPHTLLVQAPPVQSVGALHIRPFAHFGQIFPPQSRSVSSWLRTWSLHEPGMHRLFTHSRLAQSELW